MILETLFWVSAHLPANGELSKQVDTKELSGMHSRHMTHPAETTVKDGSLNAGKKHPREGILVNDVALLTDVKVSSKLHLLFQTCDIWKIQGLCLTSIRKG